MPSCLHRVFYVFPHSISSAWRSVISSKHSSRSWEWVSVEGHDIGCQCCSSPHTTWAPPPIPSKPELEHHCNAPDSVLCRGSRVFLRFLRCKMWVMVLWTRWQQYETYIYMLWVQLKCVKWSEKTWIISTVTSCERWVFLIWVFFFFFLFLLLIVN